MTLVYLIELELLNVAKVRGIHLTIVQTLGQILQFGWAIISTWLEGRRIQSCGHPSSNPLPSMLEHPSGFSVLQHLPIAPQMQLQQVGTRWMREYPNMTHTSSGMSCVPGAKRRQDNSMLPKDSPMQGESSSGWLIWVYSCLALL